MGFADALRGYFERELKDSKWIPRHCTRHVPIRGVGLKWAISHFLVNITDYTVTRRLNFRAEG